MAAITRRTVVAKKMSARHRDGETCPAFKSSKNAAQMPVNDCWIACRSAKRSDPRFASETIDALCEGATTGEGGGPQGRALRLPARIMGRWRLLWTERPRHARALPIRGITETRWDWPRTEGTRYANRGLRAGPARGRQSAAPRLWGKRATATNRRMRATPNAD